MTNSARLDALLREWSLWQRSASMSTRTISDRVELITRLSVTCDPIGCDWQPLAALLADSSLSAGTRVTYFGVLRAWYHWLQRMGYRGDDPTDKLHTPRTPRRTPRPISTEQLQLLLTSVNRRRTRTMILLCAYQGLRVHEVAKFRGEHIRGGVLRVRGKGQLDSLLPLHPVIAAEVPDYPARGYWFPSYSEAGGPVTAKNVSAVISAAMCRAGVHGSAHALRHWYGTETLRAAGGNLRVTQELLRHANIATTAGYTRVDDTERRAALLALPAAHRR